LADAARLFGLPAETGDLVVLGGQPGQDLGLEVGECGDRLLAVGEALLEAGDFVLQAVDLGLTVVDRVTRFAHPGQSGLELLAQVGVGAGAVEGSPVDACLLGEGGDVALAARRDFAAKKLVDGGS
jgi:hypothetical protein